MTLTNRIGEVYTDFMPETGIFKTEPFYRKAVFWQVAVPVSLLLLFLITFHTEIGDIWKLVGNLVRGGDHLVLGTAIRSFVLTVFNIGAFTVFFTLGLLLVAQFVLPVRTVSERWKVFVRLYLYLSKRHGPAVKVREGKIVASEKELKRSLPGVAFVDLCSAIALEKRWLPIEMGGNKATPHRRKFSIRRLARILGVGRSRKKGDREEAVRVLGPGIAFTEMGEKVRGVADLRRHFRLTPNINGYTRDGFEIRTHVWVMFSLGEPAEVIKAVSVGDWAEDVQALQIMKHVRDGKTIQTIKLVDEFESADKAEIYHMVQQYQEPEFAESPPDGSKAAKPPYTFNKERVFAAIYAQAQTGKENEMEYWADLPGKVAIEVFRDRISMKNLDDLLRPDVAYDPKDPGTFPLGAFRGEISRAMRNLGVLSYQFMRRKDGRYPVNGMEWNEDEWEELPVQELRNPKVLRDRGVRVIAAGFPELHPTSKDVVEGLTEVWMARWQQREQITEADHDLQATRLRAKVIAETQRDILSELYQIRNQKELSRPQIAERIFLALEKISADPATQRLLPSETLNLLWDLRQYLLPADDEVEE